MQLEPNDLLLFCRIVEAGSFSRAAERLAVPKSTLSRRMTVLEAQLGERLLLRTTRKLSLTDFGASVLEHAQQVANEVDAAQSLAQHRQARPSGKLRVSMPGDFANVVLASMLAKFIADHPAITLELDLSPRRVDLISENIDLAIRMGKLSDDATLAARRLTEFCGGLYAAPAYLARHGTPHSPEELMQHETLRLLRRDGSAASWQLSDGQRQWEGLPPTRAAINSPELLTRLARAGCGIALADEHFARPWVQSGELVRVLPEWAPRPATAWIVFPGRRLMPARTRVFIDALCEEFGASEHHGGAAASHA